MRALPAVVSAVLALLASPALSAAPRVWTDVEGRTVEAEFVSADATSVLIRRTADLREFTLPRQRLSADDEVFVARTLATETAAAAAAESAMIEHLNRALGLPLFTDAELWNDAPAAVAARLDLRPESITSGAESWRRYARPAVPVLGVPAYMVSLRSEDGRVADLNLLFTNRGDHPDFAGRDAGPVGPTARAAFEAALARDFQALRSALATALPKGEIEPPLARRRAMPDGGKLALFVAGPHEFALQLWPEQMIALRIQPTERAAPPRLSDERARQRLLAGVSRRAHGDVILDRIPMVDQGPKGYCVPATFERLLRHAGIPADLYELAALGGTGFGGGTQVSRLVDALERTIRQAGRRLETIRLEPSPAALARYLDDGRPVLWAMSSTPAFNLLANTYSTERAALLATNPTPEALRAWALARRKQGAELVAVPEAAHLCLLTGYNRATGEIAFSDSWGPDFAERWLPADAARRVSSGEAWVLGL